MTYITLNELRLAIEGHVTTKYEHRQDFRVKYHGTFERIQRNIWKMTFFQSRSHLKIVRYSDRESDGYNGRIDLES